MRLNCATILALATGLMCAGSAAATAAAPRSASVDAAYVAAQHIAVSGNLVLARKIDDAEGEHLLVLSRKAGPSPSAPHSGRVEQIALEAVYYGRKAQLWTPLWSIHDGVDCLGLDVAAAFFAGAVAVTDLNGDGKAEVTVPYRFSCGGGVDSAQIKIILRDGPVKLAIRGESRVELPGQAGFGGEHTHDKALSEPANAAFKQHLDAVWRAVSMEKR